MNRLYVCAIALVVLVGCRADPPPQDTSLLDWESPVLADEEPLDGPAPWVSGERRLNIGLFYEGGSSDFIPIDNDTSNYFIFQADGALTFNQIEDPDRIEGLVSSRILRTGTPWLGGGIVWSSGRNLSSWTRLYLSLKSSSESFADIGIAMTSDGGNATLSMADYGFVNDGEWHTLVIPLGDFAEAGVDLSRVTSPLQFDSGPGASGDFFKIDDVYMTAE